MLLIKFVHTHIMISFIQSTKIDQINNLLFRDIYTCNVTTKKSKKILDPRVQADGFLGTVVRWKTVGGRCDPTPIT